MSSRPFAIITGGGRGIGAATTLRLARAGYDLCVCYHRDEVAAQSTIQSALSEAQKKSREARAVARQLDVSDPEAVRACFAELDREFGRLDALVNNAGILDRPATVAEIEPERLQRMFAVNVFGAFYCAREAISRMSMAHHGALDTKPAGAGGAIVNVSSGASKSGSAFEFVDYAATKGALDSFTIGLSKEVAAEGIRVNAVRPGFIESDIHERIGDVAARRERFLPQIPMGRTGAPDEVAAAIVWLLSKDAAYVTGALLDIAGGR
ncbi:MAG: SDR family oxidoreductase [bacterium]|nr:SDR family oxidoreductase [bacterium]